MSLAVYQPLDHVRKSAHVDSLEKYKEMHEQSLKDPEVCVSAGLPRGGLPAARPHVLTRMSHPPPLRRPRAPLPALQAFWGAFMDQFHWNKKWDSGENFHK